MSNTAAPFGSSSFGATAGPALSTPPVEGLRRGERSRGGVCEVGRGAFVGVLRIIPSSSPSAAADGSAGRRGERIRPGGANDARRGAGWERVRGWDAVRFVKRPVPLPLDEKPPSSDDDDEASRRFDCLRPLDGRVARSSIGQDAAGTPAACPPAGGLPYGGIACPDVESSVWEGLVDGENDSVSPVETWSVCIVCAALTADNL